MIIFLEFNSIQPVETLQATFDSMIRENPMGEASMLADFAGKIFEIEPYNALS